MAEKKTPQKIIKNTCSFLQSFGYACVRAEFDGGNYHGDVHRFAISTKIPNAEPAPFGEWWHSDAVRFDEFRNQCVEDAPTPQQRIATRTQLDDFDLAVRRMVPPDFKSGEGSYGYIDINIFDKKIDLVVHERISDVRTHKTSF